MPAMLRKMVRRPKKRPRMRSGTRSPIQATQALLPITLEDRADRHDGRGRGGASWTASTSSVGSASSGQEGQPRDADGPERDGLAAARAGEPGGGQAHDLGAQWQRAQEADHRRARAQVERPADDHGPGGAGGKDLREGALGDGGVERAAQRPGRRRRLGGRPIRSRGARERGAGGRGADSPGWGIEKAEAMRASEASTTEARSVFKAVIRNCTSRAIARRSIWRGFA